MGTSLTGQQIKNTYKSLIKTSDSTEASATAKLLSDGNGNDFGVYIDTDGVFGIGSAPSYSLDVSSRTDGVALPVGTTANRPTGFNGLIRYNSTIGKVEFYDTGWKTIFTTSGGTISGSVTITGDLTVQGDNTIIEAQTVEVEDNILNLNRTQGSPDTATATTSGISIYRGDGVTEASFIFDDFDDTWDLTNNLVIAGTLQSSSYTDGTATLTGGTLSGAVLADGVTATTQANSDNSTKIATTAYVKSVVTLEDLDFAGGTGTGSVDLDSQTFTIAGTANEIETSASGQTLTIGLPDDVVITGDLTVDTNTLYVDSADNRVGIGTTDPKAKLHIDSNASGEIARFTSTADGTQNSGFIGLGIYDTLNNPTVSIGVEEFDASDFRGSLTFATRSSNSDVAPTEKLRIDSSGNLILNTGNSFTTGTTNSLRFSPSNTLERYSSINVENDGSNNLSMYFETRDSGVISEKMRIHSGGDISFRDTSANEAFYWDASAASLGIGVGSSPSYPLHISSTLGYPVLVERTNSNDAGIRFKDQNTTDADSVRIGAIGNDFRVFTNGTERMRITSGGDLRFNTTVEDPISSKEDGFTIGSGGDGRVKIFHNNATALLLGRGTEANIVSFYYNSTGTAVNVGNIAITATGASISLGGIAAANTLDDYEEGTWTMGIAFGGASTGVTYSTNTGTYTKIGRQVTLNGYIQLSNKGSSTGNATITGLPFGIPNSLSSYSVTSLFLDKVTFANQYAGVGAINTTTINLQECTEAGGVSSLTEGDFANNSEIILSFTYFV